MCGICGIVSFTDQIVLEKDVVEMRDSMVNRGPDDAGVVIIDGHVGLGHRRLSVIDLSQNGHQPMFDSNKDVCLVFNGEIYNFQALRKDLEKDGYEFVSKSDTEVIVHGYHKWGSDLFQHLDGMFGIAIWDNKTQKLILGRDRFGKKPLYYYCHEEQIYFSSDIKSIWALHAGHLELNYVALDLYFHHLSTTQDHSIFKGINKVLPGHFLVFDGANTSGSMSEYWAPSFKNKENISEEETIDKMDACFKAAVKKRLVSDVPVGTFLSGGVDSGMVVAMTAQLSSTPCKTFSIGFDEQEYSELSYAKLVAQRYGTEHHEIILKPDVLDILPSLVWEYGEPFADSSAVPTYYVSKAAREYVTVALTGDGGDELFAGYNSARAAHYASFLKKSIPNGVRNTLLQVSSGKLKTLLSYASDNLKVRHSHSMAFADNDKQRLYTEAFAGLLNGHHSSDIYARFDERVKGLDTVDQNLFYTIVGKLPNDYLTKIDVASMKNSLEIRSPFLDADLNSLSESIPSELKIHKGQQKYLLKKLAEKYLPLDIIYKKKQGFELPIAHWFRSSLGDVFERMVLESGCLANTGLFDMTFVGKILEEHKSTKQDHSHRLWSLLWLEVWFRLFVDGSLKPSDSLKQI